MICLAFLRLVSTFSCGPRSFRVTITVVRPFCYMPFCKLLAEYVVRQELYPSSYVCNFDTGARKVVSAAISIRLPHSLGPGL